MTAIAGIVHEQTVYLGADSAATRGDGHQTSLASGKIFYPDHAPWLLIGVCGSVRLSQIVRHNFRPPLPPADDGDVMAYMAHNFVDALRRLCEASGSMTETRRGEEMMQGDILIGFQGRLFVVDCAFQVLSEPDPHTAVGSGAQLALGALFATVALPPVDRLELALNAAAAYQADVRGPFYVKDLAYVQNLRKHIKQSMKPAKKKTRGKKVK